MVRTLVIIMSLMALTACSSNVSVPEWIGDQNPNRYGYKPHDPCFRCGESWIFLPQKPISPSDQKVYN